MSEDEASSAQLIEDIQLPPKLKSELTRAGTLRDKSNELQSESRRMTENLACKLVVDLGLSLRDVSELLSLSHQRVHQIVTESRSGGSKASRILKKIKS